MLYEMTATQKEKFINTSGYEYDDVSLSGSFMFEFNQENGHLICKLSHRMTNNRIY
jgi:hypothetical protein